MVLKKNYKNASKYLVLKKKHKNGIKSLSSAHYVVSECTAGSGEEDQLAVAPGMSLRTDVGHFNAMAHSRPAIGKWVSSVRAI